MFCETDTDWLRLYDDQFTSRGVVLPYEMIQGIALKTFHCGCLLAFSTG